MMGELGSTVIMVVGLASCLGTAVSDSYTGDIEHRCNDDLMTAGLAGLVIFKVWEIIDVWACVPGHNRRYRELKEQHGEPAKVSFYLLPNLAQPGLGLSISF